MSTAYAGTPVIASGLEYIIERAYREMQPYMWAREAAVNALEAEATRIEFTVEWQAVENLGVYRRVIIDNGWAMNARELDLFRQFGESSKRIFGAPNENYGVGVKSGCWPWNPYGFVVVSRKDGETNMLWVYNGGSGYELKQFPVIEDEDDQPVLKHVFPTFEDDEHGCDWDAVLPDWVGDSGTALILLGESPAADTIRGDASKGEDGLAGVQKFLNERLYSLPDGVEIRSIEFVNADREGWPRSVADKTGKYVSRSIRGARSVSAYWDASPASGRVPLSDGTDVEWILAETDPPKNVDDDSRSPAAGYHGRFARRGRIAVVNHDEVYDINDHHSTYRTHGITSTDVARRLTLFYHVKPLANQEPRRGETLVYDTTGRSLLLCNSAQPLPREAWAEEFALKLPSEISEALKRAREKEIIEGGVDDEEAAKKLQARFGARWKTAVLRMTQKGGERMDPSIPGSTPRVIRRKKKSSTSTDVAARGGQTGLKQGEQNTVGFASPDGTAAGKKSQAALDLPRVAVVSASEFMDDADKWAVAWISPSPVEPRGLVQICRDHPVVQEQAEYWAQRVPDYAVEEALKKVPFILGEIVACNIAHNNRFKAVEGEQGVEARMRNPAALTNVILGLIQTDAVIGPKLGYLGKQKTAV
jgi:hypothetical protein